MSRFNSTVRRTVAIGAAAALALGMAACSGSGGSSSGQTTVVWSTWGTPQELTRYKEFDTQFMKDHPDIKVVLQPVADYGDYHTKLLAQLASGTAPDVFYIGDDKIGQFVSSSALMPLTDLMNSSASLTKPDDFAQ
ncbi:MAG: extracellular solute-binding protein [Terrimesophilobacter sp.]